MFLLVPARSVLTSHVAQLCVLPDFVGRPGADWVPIHIQNGLLPHVDPDDWSVFWVLVAADQLDGLLEAGQSWLAAAVDLVTGHASPIGQPGYLVGQLLDLFKVVGHGHGLPDLGVLLIGHDDDVDDDGVVRTVDES